MIIIPCYRPVLSQKAFISPFIGLQRIKLFYWAISNFYLSFCNYPWITVNITLYTLNKKLNIVIRDKVSLNPSFPFSNFFSFCMLNTLFKEFDKFVARWLNDNDIYATEAELIKLAPRIFLTIPNALNDPITSYEPRIADLAYDLRQKIWMNFSLFEPICYEVN